MVAAKVATFNNQYHEKNAIDNPGTWCCRNDVLQQGQYPVTTDLA